jgi:hypothetical protein
MILLMVSALHRDPPTVNETAIVGRLHGQIAVDHAHHRAGAVEDLHQISGLLPPRTDDLRELKAS